MTTGQISDNAQLRYYDCRDTLGLLVEVISDTPDTRAFFDVARQGAERWDGAGPVLRPLPAMGDTA